METIIITGIASVSKSFLTHMIYDSYDLIKDTAAHNNPYLQEIINDMDLHADFKVIGALLEEISDDKTNKAVGICLKNVSDMVQEIKSELEAIKQEIIEHEARWFAGWRTPNYEKNIKNLIKHKKILDNRVDLLIKLLRVE